MINLTIKIHRPSVMLVRWLQEGEFHRVDGPASVWYCGDGEGCYYMIRGSHVKFKTINT